MEKAERKQKIDLYWFRHSQGFGNFGDELSPWVVRRMAAGAEVRWADPLLAESGLVVRAAKLAKSLLRPTPSRHDLRYSRWHAVRMKPTLLGIGSIIRRARNSATTVWGSGILSRSDSMSGGRFLAVRGPITRQRLTDLGLQAPQAMGDPALLAPLLFKPTESDNHDVSIVPHHVHYDQTRTSADRRVRVLDLTDNIETILQAISASRVTLSTSLHGVIVSQALGVPSLWVTARELDDRPLSGDGVKFQDYFASVGIKQTEAADLGELASLTPARLRQIVDDNAGATLPSRSRIRDRQNDLLHTAPFTVSPSVLAAFRNPPLGS